MIKKAKNEGLGALASLAQKDTHASPFDEQMFLDAAAVMAMRRQIEKIIPRETSYTANWNLSEILQILDVFILLIRETMSEREEGEIEICITHPAHEILEEFKITLLDLRKGIIDPKLSNKKGYSGTSLKSLNVRRIYDYLLISENYLQAKNTTIKEAHEWTANFLKKRNHTFKNKEITAKKLKEWSRTYTREGKKERWK